MRKKLEIPERPICNAVVVFRERGNYLQRLEQFEKSIQAYNEALRWNNSDVRSLLGRSLARAKTTHYSGALADAARAAELEPKNLTASQIRAQTEYEKGAFERALVLAHRGLRERKYPPDFAECARCAEQTIRECAGRSAHKVLSPVVRILRKIDIERDVLNEDGPEIKKHRSRMRLQEKQQATDTHKVQKMSVFDKQKRERISRLMASTYLERMAHDKFFLNALCKDERLISANKKGSKLLQDLAQNALKDLEKRQASLRERRPLYAARASETAVNVHLSRTRQDLKTRAQKQHEHDAKRLIETAEKLYQQRDTKKCIEFAEFGMEQISHKHPNLLPAKEKFLQTLQYIVAKAILDQKRVRNSMSEADREKRAYVLLGMSLSREPSRDSILRVRPTVPSRDIKLRLRHLERLLSMSTRKSERCYLSHELARLHVDTKQGQRACSYASKCQSEARASNDTIWQLNAAFLLARCHLLQNNRPEARAVLVEAADLAHSCALSDVAEFYNTCANVVMEGDVLTNEELVEKRQRDMVSLMPDDELRSEAKHLFKRMSVLPAARRFSIMPGAQVQDSTPLNAVSRRMSIIPRSQQPARIAHRFALPFGFQEFDI